MMLVDQVIFDVLAANSDAHAKNYSLLFPVVMKPRLAPLNDVSTVLSWGHVAQQFAQKITRRSRKPESDAKRHWDSIANDTGFRATDLRTRVQEPADRIVSHRVVVTKFVCSMPGAAKGCAEQTAMLVEGNALRIAGRSRTRSRIGKHRRRIRPARKYEP